MSTEEKHLYSLDELKGYKVNHHDHDIRGWKVKDLENRVIGKVDNLLVNKELGKVVYVDVEVDHNIIHANHDPYAAHSQNKLHEFINKDGENHIIIPIGMIDINASDKYVYTENIDYQTFAETKRYRSGSNISRDYERHVLGSYNRRHAGERDPSDTEFEDNDFRDRNTESRNIEKTRSAYTEDEFTDEEIKRRETRRRELREEESLAEERNRRNRVQEGTTGPDRHESTDKKIRREKENLRYKSDRDRPVTDDEHRTPRNAGLQRENEHLRPQRTLDEDSEWERENPQLENEDNEAYRNRRRHRRRDHEDTFYDRKEFRDRDL